MKAFVKWSLGDTYSGDTNGNRKLTEKKKGSRIELL